MHCEIEFLPVGEGEKAGDAIVVRYGYERDYKLMLIDGGHQKTGAEIVAHLRQHFGADVRLEHIVLTHSDADHASGLRGVLEEVPVTNLWMHIPWDLAEEVRPLFRDPRWTQDGLRRSIKAEYGILDEIVTLAAAKGTPIRYPFQGAEIGPFRVMSPGRWHYGRLLPQFDKTPEPDRETIEAEGMWVGKADAFTKIFEAARAAIQSWTTETWDNERLRDGGITSASNESSVVLYSAFEGGRALLTGDAGVRGLCWTADYADRTNLPLAPFAFVQIPHHGSRRNVGPTVLNRLLGTPRPWGSSPIFESFVSAPADDAKHPRKVVINAFTRRGASTLATQGRKTLFPGGFTPRANYATGVPLPFYTQVEEYT